ncbi:hypothetical protein Micbo1qcDRAFT_39546 [Microdochium bolleyi]|uniref:Secreted protein n=1 Tax=Microdochium bolleyi TaxID=196109 RepID=A0A136J9N5_9PEZI|nr:hypothetical protein Micbo1qcDRAFT_39546 [Microdochium bolleyi]
MSLITCVSVSLFLSPFSLPDTYTYTHTHTPTLSLSHTHTLSLYVCVRILIRAGQDTGSFIPKRGGFFHEGGEEHSAPSAGCADARGGSEVAWILLLASFNISLASCP